MTTGTALSTTTLLGPLQDGRLRAWIERLRKPRPEVDRTDPAHAFKQLPGTRWLEPALLLRSAAQVVVSSVLGQYNDKRELMGALPADEPLDLSTEKEVTVDYVADSGDGFDASYTVASLLAREELTAAPPGGGAVTTRRGRLLVMGGDQCYPAADVQTYEDRLIGPFRAALPDVGPDREAPWLLVVPGNHDWYDGLTSFMRTFCQRRWIGGWHTCQSRSYFAARLPGRWWLWGIDIQFDTYVDDVQRRYFETMAERLRPGDQVVLVSAKPSWVASSEEDCEAYATLDFLERTLVRPRGATVRVAISGDRHHYTRYESADGSQKLTAGGGGAYLSPTHHLRDDIAVPPPASKARDKSDPVPYWRRAAYPDPDTSRRLARGVYRLPWRTPQFALLVGAVHGLLATALLSALSPSAHGLPEQLQGMADTLREVGPADVAGALTGTLGTVLLSTVVVGAAVAFTSAARTAKGLVAGGTHGALQLGLTVAVTSAAAALTASVPGAWAVPAFTAAAAALGGFLGTELVAAYLHVADRFGLNSNELFAAQAIPDYKNFLRLAVDAQGTLTIYPFAVDRVPRDWQVSSAPAKEGPRWLPVGDDLEVRLIEPPVVVRPLTASPADTAAAEVLA